VAALLRLQARRIDQPEARAALEEAVRRVGSIAIVHETLSQAVEETVDFDEIADRLSRLVTDVSAVSGRVRVVREGTFGVLASETATALAMVLTEILQNAVEHGYPGMADVAAKDLACEGRILVSVRRIVGRLHVVVQDDGVGLPIDFDPDTATSLGLSIVRTLVESELGGMIEIGQANEGSGARVQVDVPLD